ncbi:alpha/beta hydrolase [Azorhizobium sp. AG788]|uniref:alpha/beta hydrolase n=1 Tax=Azorhizobium sp. AG788 TaxID=2183897 RepID=UPI00313A0645
MLSPLGLLNALGGMGRHCETRSVPYGPGPRQSLDIYRPHMRGRPPAPVVVFFYGGGWVEGDRALYRFVGAALAAQGFVTVIPDYRVHPEVRFPTFLEDGARAVQWVRGQIGTFGGDPDRMVLMGHSAGAHLAAMLSFDRQWLGAYGLVPGRDLRGMVGLAGPYDFLPLRTAVLKSIFGPESRWPESQPIRFVDGTAPPAWLATGRVDTVVDPGNAVRLAARIHAAGGHAEVQTYDRVGHATLLGAISPLLRPLAPVTRDVAQFITAVTRHSPAWLAPLHSQQAHA